MNINSLPENSNLSSWKDRARFRIENKKWLGYSGKIALRILAAMEDNTNMNQKQLAKLANVSPQQISKIIKGHENLTLKSIAKFSDILGVELISFPTYKYNNSNNISVTLAAFNEVYIQLDSYNPMMALISNFQLEISNINKFNNNLEETIYEPTSGS